jgi:transposase-like protein
MPKKVHDLAMKLQKKGYSESSSWAIANAALKIKGKKKKK